MKTNNAGHFPATHRWLHWALAFLLVISFLTGFLRMEWMGKNAVISAVQQNSDLGKDQAKAIYETLRTPMWQWHIYAAYLIVIAFVARLIYMFIKGIHFPNPFDKGLSGRDRFRGSIYFLFYLFIAEQIITGLYLKFIAGSWKPVMESVHKLALYWFPIFILLHFGGIILGELTNKKGIVSKMISGD